jgi:hypothetical protein
VHSSFAGKTTGSPKSCAIFCTIARKVSLLATPPQSTCKRKEKKESHQSINWFPKKEKKKENKNETIK